MANGNPRDDYKEGKDFIWKEGAGGVKTRKFLSKAEKEAMSAPKASAASKSPKAKPAAKTPSASPKPKAKPARDTSITTRKLSPATTGRGRGDGAMETTVRRAKNAIDRAGKKDPYGIGEWEKSRAKTDSKTTTTAAMPKGTKPFKGTKPTKAELDNMTMAQKLRWGVLFNKGSATEKTKSKPTTQPAKRYGSMGTLGKGTKK